MLQMELDALHAAAHGHCGNIYERAFARNAQIGVTSILVLLPSAITAPGQ